MSFVKNGASISSGNTQNTSSSSNPFGLKDFSKMLDNKFGNSAFSSNILDTPKGADINPFAENSPQMRRTRNLQKTSNVAKPKPNHNNGHSEAYASAQVSVFGGFNQGTGMASGYAGGQTLDFKY